MRSFFSSFLALGTVLSVFAAAEPALHPYSLHEKRDAIPEGWTFVRRHDPESIIPLRIGLKQDNIESLEEYLLDVSHPKSPNYGKHWSVEKVAETFAASDETIDAVRTWLAENGFDDDSIRVTAPKSWIEVTATVEDAELLLKTEYNIYEHTSGKQHVACEAYHLPDHIKHHVDFITPTVHFAVKTGAQKRQLKSRSDATATAMVKTDGQIFSNETIHNIINQLEYCDRYITPDCLRALYDFVYTPVAADKNSYGIVEYTPVSYIPSDLQLYFEAFDTSLLGSYPEFVSIDGGYETELLDDVIEASLDLEVGMTLVTNKQKVTLYQVGDYISANGTINQFAPDDFLDAIDGSYCTYDGGNPSDDPDYPSSNGGYNGTLNCGTAKPSYVISTSYEDTEYQIPVTYAARQCAEYAKLGLMGITILYSSGDSGVGGACTSRGHEGFTPGFPASCPYVTAVGATMMEKGSTVLDPEVAAYVTTLEFYSGGGFSNYFAMPSWQKDAVDHYLTTYPPDLPSNMWNSSGVSRGIPDLSANGAQYVIAVDGVFIPVWGTSCSSPFVGAMLTMINDARLAIGKGPIGFINPTIYSPEFSLAFNDITSGNNPGCNTTGFNATKGWDPVTGLGTPNFPKLLALWLLL